jgi:hypothetical protein
MEREIWGDNSPRFLAIATLEAMRRNASMSTNWVLDVMALI